MEFFIVPDDFESFLCGKRIEISFIGGGFFIVVPGQSPAGEIIKGGVHQIQADLIVHFAAGAFGIETAGGGMVQGDSGDDPHFHSLFFGKIRHRFQRLFFGIHTQKSVGGFDSTGNGGGGCRRICDDMRG